MLSVRTSFQTMRRWRGFPVFLSHTRVLSLWLVMPTAARSVGFRRAFSRADLTQCPTLLFVWEGSGGGITKEARRGGFERG